jgi:hypothetical protein
VRDQIPAGVGDRHHHAALVVRRRRPGDQAPLVQQARLLANPLDDGEVFTGVGKPAAPFPVEVDLGRI